LLSGERVLAARHEDMAKGQAERLMPLLEEILAEAAVGWRDLAALGVGIGPGNFTGIRIAVSAARGLALSLGIPAVGVSALEAQAFGVPGVVVSSLDARRGGLYVHVLGTGEQTVPVLCDLATLPPCPAQSGPNCIGYGNDEIAALCTGRSVSATMPIAEAIARIAMRHSHDLGLPRPAPLYLRGADAAPSRDVAPAILS
jgi:tRNA threonylcarbamoyl adenosine modification protein YeaZ